MRYQATEQYQRGEERFVAEFSEYESWKIFKTVRVAEDETQKRAILYRLYENSECIEVVNQSQICIATAQYADGGRLIEISPPLIYGVLLRTQSVAREKAYFEYYSDVKLFLDKLSVCDRTLGDHDVFCLFKHGVLIETFPVHTLHTRGHAEASPLTAHFNPMPTPTTFKPPGFPQDHWRENEEPDETRD